MSQNMVMPFKFQFKLPPIRMNLKSERKIRHRTSSLALRLALELPVFINE